MVTRSAKDKAKKSVPKAKETFKVSTRSVAAVNRERKSAEGRAATKMHLNRINATMFEKAATMAEAATSPVRNRGKAAPPLELDAVLLLPPETPVMAVATIVNEGEPTPAVTPPLKEKGADVTPAPVATDLPSTAPDAIDTGEMTAGTIAWEFLYAKDAEEKDKEGGGRERIQISTKK